MSDTDDRPGVLIARITIEKYATDDGVDIYIDGMDGVNDGIPLVDALGMLEFAKQHTWDSIVYADEDDDRD